jgi:hypothetical protein
LNQLIIDDDKEKVQHLDGRGKVSGNLEAVCGGDGGDGGVGGEGGRVAARGRKTESERKNCGQTRER